MQRPSLRSGALLGVAGIILALGGAPLLAQGADHLDAPALGHTSSGMTVDLVSTHGDRDINDVYVFNNAAHTDTVFAMTTNPAVNVPSVDPTAAFGTNVRYILNVDRNGDAIQDLAYVFRFGPASNSGAQSYTVTRYTGANARSLAIGTLIGWGSTSGSGVGSARGGAKVFAGVRADPFFFDLLGFLGTVLGVGTTQLGHGGDFFAELNTNAMVLEVPNDSLGASNIGVWGVTTYWANGRWNAADQMGRPAINTVFNNKYVAGSNVGAEKDLFNATPPSKMRTADGGVFRSNIVNTLESINGLLVDGCSDYDPTTAGAIADFLLPDVLTYKVGSTADGTTFNGRAPADDVIDAELAVTTNGCVTTDNVGPHTYLSLFPYLNVPH
ncbi:MAG TPA: DUF4331 family protein [Candidatus Limnocylindrales bacterium]|nr:DUF4331 family protein [Candidatus Limnocylindrales bacterium]